VWQLRLPRVVLAALVGAMLAAGAPRTRACCANSLADPFLLGVAAGAGLGATVAIVTGHGGGVVLPRRPSSERVTSHDRAGRAARLTTSAEKLPGSSCNLADLLRCAAACR